MIKIVGLNKSNSSYINTFNGEFVIDSRFVIRAENNQFDYTIESIEPYKKQYDNDEINPEEYMNNPNKDISFALYNSNFAGQIILRKNWNYYAYIEDIRVDSDYRRIGIGKKLIEYAVKWTKEMKLAGIMLETQNNNVKACKFYESCGFEIGGFDCYLYKGINKKNNEIAIYWYYLL